MRVLAVITARGGSKGLARKNVLPLAGKPLIAHTIQAATDVKGLIGNLIVSTDDDEIAEVSRTWGAETPFMRPSDLSQDDTPSLPVVQHAVESMETTKSCRYDWVLLLQPTSPLRRAEDIIAAIEIASTGQPTAVVSVTDANDCHPFKLKVVEDGFLRAYGGGQISQARRQDLKPEVFRTNGAIYLTRRDVLMEQNNFYGPSPMAYVMPDEQSVDIDTKLDFDIAEFLLSRNHEGRKDA